MMMNQRTRNFTDWLLQNGAKFDKIQWPSTNIVTNIRGATAITDINTNEYMLEIPKKLMMSPEHAYDSEIGKYLADNKDVIRGDSILALYLMYERIKGESSFYYPYLQILPSPGTIAEWTQNQLLQLQDDSIVLRARRKKLQVKTLYTQCVIPLCEKYPEIFSFENYSSENFEFCWYSIQARAFGRRLPWSAMVPFADCLNHSNVQTKYDFDIDHNGYFRLFPTGNNNYKAGTEVYNSYGRRHNENLLLDYGFAMLDNEWDHVSISLKLPVSDNYDRKATILLCLGYNPSIMEFKIFGNDYIPHDALKYLRIVALDEIELEYIESCIETFDKDETITNYKKNVSILLREIITIKNEINALNLLSVELNDMIFRRITTTEEDEVLLTELNNNSSTNDDGNSDDNEWRLNCSIIYRLTRKHIIDSLHSKILVLKQTLDVTFSEKVSYENIDLYEVFGILNKTHASFDDYARCFKKEILLRL